MTEMRKRTETRIGDRFLIGEPSGTFTEIPRVARQPGKNAHRTDWAADVARIGGMTVMAASMRGAMHYGLSTVRQDSFAIGRAGDIGERQWAVAAIADGVSSAALSHALADYMARQAVLTVGEELQSSEPSTLHNVEWSRIARRLAEISVAFCRNAAKRAAPEDNSAAIDKAAPMDFTQKWATTLEFAVVRADKEEDAAKKEFVHVTVAGDGAAYILNRKEGWKTVKTGKRQSGPLASNAVLSLPLTPDHFSIEFGFLGKSDCLILATDGLSDFIGDGDTPLGDFFRRKLPKCKSLASFLQITDVSMYQADDDRTVIMLRRAG